MEHGGEDADAVGQLLDLARDIFGTPVALLSRRDTLHDDADQVSSTLCDVETVRLLDRCDLDAAPGVDVTRPDGSPVARLMGVSDPPCLPLDSRQLEALHVVAALVAGILHHRQLRLLRRSVRLSSLDALIAGEGRQTVVQPIVDLRNGGLVGAEALSRFTSADGSPQYPEQVFIDARSAGVGIALERAAIASALDLVDTLPAGAYLGVNASADALLDPGTQALLLSGQPERLVVEVTERDPVQDYEVLTRGTADLRQAGIRLAVDDAGAGFASLQHVLHLAPDIVKLDVAFVRGIDTDPARRAVARAIVGLAAEVGSVMVAEGVEKAAELVVLKELGVDCGQGYLFGRPSAKPGWFATMDDGTTATDEIRTCR